MLPAGLLFLRDAHRRGDVELIERDGDRVVAELHAAGDATAATEAALILTVVRAAAALPTVATDHLHHVLAHADALPVEARREIPALDTAELLLIDRLLLLGRYYEAAGRVPPLLEPDRAPSTRFAGTRVQAAIAALRGQPERAHQHLNTAGGLAARLRSGLLTMLVEADRAMVLAGQGRQYEAVAVADRALAALSRPASGPHGDWTTTQAAVVALSLTRRTAALGDTMTAQRLLIAGTAAAERVRGPWIGALLDLATGAFWSAEADPYRAEPALLAAQRGFAALGAEPGSALADLELGRLSLRRGLLATARPLLEHAHARFQALGHATDAAEARGLLGSLHHLTDAPQR